MEIETGIFLVLIFATAGMPQNSMISCPQTFYKEESSHLNIAVNNSTFSICDIKPSLVTCRWHPENATSSVICSGSVTSCEKDATSSTRCHCVEEHGLGFKYRFNFWMLPNQKSGHITCDLDCAVVTPTAPTAKVDSGPNCQNINFVSKCFKNGQCKRGTCRFNENNEDVCDCTGTRYAGTSCEKLDPFLIALICVSTLLGVVMAAVGAGVYCAKKQWSGGQQNASPAFAPPANAPLTNALPDNATPYNTPPYNAHPVNAPQVAGSAGPSTGQTVQTTPYDEPGESSVAGSEASEGTEYSASEVSEV